MTCEIHSNYQPWIKIDKLESALRYDREDMAQVIQNLMSDQTTKEEVLGLQDDQIQVLIDLLQNVSLIVVITVSAFNHPHSSSTATAVIADSSSVRCINWCRKAEISLLLLSLAVFLL